ncbi:hypothetical protein PT286_06305 [Neisseriaceae bacterium ESL0693]|nr:hypothetical protein [Neisseriaceae bacterium ESL0693]
MQKKITVNCPKCRTKNVITPPPVPGSQIMCTDCHHQFKIVPRNAAKSRSEPPAQPDKPSVALSSRVSAGKLVKTQMLEMVQKTSIQPPVLNSLLNQSVNQDIERLTREPAKTKNNQHSTVKTSADLINSINNLHENKISVESPGMHAAIVASEISQSDHPDSTTVNNLNNLVFTLLPNAEAHKQADVPLLLNDTIEKTEAIHVKTQYLHDQQDKLSKEFNWTLASLVALTTLMMQLFYLMAVK